MVGVLSPGLKSGQLARGRMSEAVCGPPLTLMLQGERQLWLAIAQPPKLVALICSEVVLQTDQKAELRALHLVFDLEDAIKMGQHGPFVGGLLLQERHHSFHTVFQLPLEAP